jgi:hypothetical protein
MSQRESVVSKEYASKYFKASEFGGREMRLIIDHVEEGVEMGVGERRARKNVLHFLETEQALVLNKGNAETLAQGLGDNSNGWSGAAIVLYTVPTPVGDSIKVRVGGKRPPLKQAPPSADASEDNPPPYSEEELADIFEDRD